MAHPRPPAQEQAHDVLAAEEFAMPASDPSLHPPDALPDDPSGIVEPHDVLAAEEFAMPAGPHHPAGEPPYPRLPAWRRVVAAAAAVGVPLIVIRRIRRRR